MSNGDTNFKDYDPKKGYSNPDNPKDRGGNYDQGQDFDATHGHKNPTDDVATADLAEEEEEQEEED